MITTRDIKGLHVDQARDSGFRDLLCRHVKSDNTQTKDILFLDDSNLGKIFVKCYRIFWYPGAPLRFIEMHDTYQYLSDHG